MKTSKSLNVLFFAALRESAKTSEVQLKTQAQSLAELYGELSERYNFSLSLEQLKVAINNEFVEMDADFKENDTVVFIPPVSGG